MPEIKVLGYHITYDRDDGYNKVSKGDVSVKLYEYEQGLPYLDAEKRVTDGTYSATYLHGLHQ